MITQNIRRQTQKRSVSLYIVTFFGLFFSFIGYGWLAFILSGCSLIALLMYKQTDSTLLVSISFSVTFQGLQTRFLLLKKSVFSLLLLCSLFPHNLTDTTHVKKNHNNLTVCIPPRNNVQVSSSACLKVAMHKLRVLFITFLLQLSCKFKNTSAQFKE